MSGAVRLGIKRAFDIVAATCILLVLSPVLVIAAAAITITMGFPVLYRQERLGKDGRVFRILKFRTMTNETDSEGNLLPDEDRITRLGKLLRSFTIDELPELFNVIAGDMSLVGPRALLAEYKDLYSPRQLRRHEMRPGMAGPVLAAGRNSLSWDEKFELDVQYIENWSLRLDARLLVATFWRVVRSKDVSAPGSATMPRFEGAVAPALLDEPLADSQPGVDSRSGG